MSFASNHVSGFKHWHQFWGSFLINKARLSLILKRSFSFWMSQKVNKPLQLQAVFFPRNHIQKFGSCVCGYSMKFSLLNGSKLWFCFGFENDKSKYQLCVGLKCTAFIKGTRCDNMNIGCNFNMNICK